MSSSDLLSYGTTRYYREVIYCRTVLHTVLSNHDGYNMLLTYISGKTILARTTQAHSASRQETRTTRQDLNNPGKSADRAIR